MLSHGPDHEPGRWTSPLALAIAGIVLVAFVLLVRVLIDRPAAHQPASQPSAPAVTPPGEVPPLPFGVTAKSVRGPKEPTRFSGTVTGSGSGWGSGQLLLTGPRPGWLSIATDTFRPITGLPQWQAGYGFTRMPGGWAVQQYSPPQADCRKCDAPPAVYFVADGGSRRSAHAAPVGAAYAAAAAANASDLWLTAYLPEADIGASSGTAQEVTQAGQGVGAPLQLPTGYVIDRAVRGGFLLAPYAPPANPVSDELWDPRTGQVIGTFANVIAASPEQIAWNPCPGRCPLKILTFPGKKTLSVRTALTIPLAPRTWADSGTFSATGNLLALQVSTAVQRDGSAAATRLEVIDTATGQVTSLPGTTLSSQIGVSFGWQPGTESLVAAIAQPSGFAQLAVWQPGYTDVLIRPLRLPGQSSPVLGDHT
jgi:hypothetical protein